MFLFIWSEDVNNLLKTFKLDFKNRIFSITYEMKSHQV